MAKTIIFYGRDSAAAKKRGDELHPDNPDSHQIVQADAWHGERLEGDRIEFAADVTAGERSRIEAEWGKFDNRQSFDQSSATGDGRRGMGGASLGGVERTPASDRRNLDPEARVDDPNKVKAVELKPAHTQTADNPSPGQPRLK